MIIRSFPCCLSLYTLQIHQAVFIIFLQFDAHKTFIHGLFPQFAKPEVVYLIVRLIPGQPGQLGICVMIRI